LGKLILVTGGARSGKSSFAEETAKSYNGDVLYIATSIPVDDEMRFRIQKHREQRPKTWETIEAYKDLDLHLKNKLIYKSAVLLDCITIMVTNIMLEECSNIDIIETDEAAYIETRVKQEIEKLIEIINNSQSTFIIVTNEVGMGVVPEYPSGRVFRDIAGRANQMLAKVADEVHLCVSGIPVKIK
jgi:adenosylcobinamide kinase / adenosylcobinamide-phosphate guanylyltransferase